MKKGLFNRIWHAITHVETAHFIWHSKLVQVWLAPVIGSTATAILGIIEHQPAMWVVMAAALVFMGIMQGLLRGSEYASRKSPQNKLVYEGTYFSVELNAAPIPKIHSGNRGQRRIAAKITAHDEPQILQKDQLMAGVKRTMKDGQISVSIKNTASFPISWYVENADTEIDSIRAIRGHYPSEPTLLLPGVSVRVADKEIDLDDAACAPLAGKMEFIIKYGHPGKEEFELLLRGNLNIQMTDFGFVPNVATEWKS